MCQIKQRQVKMNEENNTYVYVYIYMYKCMYILYIKLASHNLKINFESLDGNFTSSTNVMWLIYDSKPKQRWHNHNPYIFMGQIKNGDEDD